MTQPTEYQARLWVGGVLALITGLILFFDPAPIYPGLLVLFLVLGPTTLAELHRLLARQPRQPFLVVLGGVAFIHASNWLPHVWPRLVGGGLPLEPLAILLAAVVFVFVAAFAWEMAFYREPGGSIVRIALTTWMVLYLGLLPSFLVQLRWDTAPAAEPGAWFNWHGAILVALAVFVPKAGDVGAYFAGKTLGRNRMTPALSPKKTWEGFIGGLTSAALLAVGVHLAYPVIFSATWLAACFGLTVGLAGVLGDLAESLIKRDVRQKDASDVVPGFGGLLDVVDSVLFAAPMAYLWLR